MWEVLCLPVKELKGETELDKNSQTYNMHPNKVEKVKHLSFYFPNQLTTLKVLLHLHRFNSNLVLVLNLFSFLIQCIQVCIEEFISFKRNIS